MTTCMMPPIMYAWDGCILCVCRCCVHVGIHCASCTSLEYSNVFIGMTFLPNVLPPPKKARPSRCPSNQENALLPNMALLPIGENMGKIKPHCSLLVGRFYNLRPSSTHSISYWHSVDPSSYPTRILHVQPSVSALESFVPKSWREKKKKTTCDWCLWLVNYVYVLAASNQTQINIYNKHIYIQTWYMIPNTNLPTAKKHENKKTTLNPLLRCDSL